MSAFFSEMSAALFGARQSVSPEAIPWNPSSRNAQEMEQSMSGRPRLSSQQMMMRPSAPLTLALACHKKTDDRRCVSPHSSPSKEL
jgi:hypothetical protein